MTLDRINPKSIITIEAKREKARKGSKTGDVWYLVKSGQTIESFIKAFGKTKYAKHENGYGFLSYFRREGNIKIRELKANKKAA
jgi:hypothetical protein